MNNLWVILLKIFISLITLFNKYLKTIIYFTDGIISVSLSRCSSYHRSSSRPSKFKSKRRQTFHSGHHQRSSLLPMHFEVAEVFEKPVSNLSVPRIIPQHSYDATSRDVTHVQRQRLQVKLFLIKLKISCNTCLVLNKFTNFIIA